MHENHLTYFKVENFKRFESFEMENIGQFNLITGDNNVGKTSVLEALLFNNDPSEFGRISGYLLERKGLFVQNNPLLYFFQNQNTKGKIRYYFNKLGKPVLLKRSMQGNFSFREEENEFVCEFNPYINEYYFPIPYIEFSNRLDFNLSWLYSQYIQNDRNRKNQLISNLRTIIPDIEYIEISTIIANQPTLIITQKNINAVMPLATFGDGAIKLFRILIDVVVNSGQRLMIDEIDAGIHHDRFPDFWRAILKACKENDVQLFATTHNWECLEFFKNVLEEPEMTDYQKDARHFEIKALRNGKIKAYHYDFEQFKFAIENNHEIRGGR